MDNDFEPRMRSESIDLKQYDTDKGQSGYLRHYDRMFASLVNQPINLLEIGVRKGGSLALWRDYFPRGAITGIDLNPPDPLIDGTQFFQGSQADTKFLTDVATIVAPDGFDVIIDDASHLATLTKTTFDHLFHNHLKPGGLYVIEDWGTGYWDSWPDGRRADWQSDVSLMRRALRKLLPRSNARFFSHDYGLVGYIKQLVDRVGAADLRKGMLGGQDARLSQIETVTIASGICFAEKAIVERAPASYEVGEAPIALDFVVTKR